MTSPSHCNFAVLSPGFVTAHVEVRASLPTTLHDIMLRLQAARPTASVRRFPWTVPARPQPCPGNGVVLALPAWCGLR